jgi:hypothetical protein
MSSETQVAPAEQQTQVSESVTTGLENTKTITEQIQNWKDSLPDDLKAEKALESIQDIPGLAKSYIHAQKMIGVDKIPIPNKHATEEDWQAVYDKLGRPKSPDEYKFNFKDDTTVDEKALAGFKETAHKYGLLPKQAEAVMEFYNNMTNNYMEELNSKAEQGRMQAEQSLKKEWGPAYENKLKQVGAIAKKYLDDNFENILLSDGTKIGDHPSFVKAFAEIASDLGEDQLISAKGPQYMTIAEIDKQIASLQQQGSAYWDKNHPSHKLAVQEVQDLLALKHNSR